jgi:hypothetical protein
MRYLKRQNVNRRIANDTTLYSDTAGQNVYVQPNLAGSVSVPVGTNAQRPGSPTNGMMRYSTDAVTNGQIEVYSAGRWRALRYVEQKQITQQNLGAGDGANTYFGPLNSTWYNPANNANNTTVGAQNILVIVENVIQVSTINYTVVQNPTLPTEVYSPKLSLAAGVGATTLYFNSSLFITGASGTGATATVTFATQPQVPFAIGASIVITAVNATGTGSYNGSFTVTASTVSSVSFSSTATATYQNGGEVDAVGAVYPTVNLIGATITGSNLPGGTTIVSYVIDPNTDALLSIVVSNAITTGTVPINTTYTITKTGGAGSGYYLNFSTPVPYGKVVIALLGFDS